LDFQQATYVFDGSVPFSINSLRSHPEYVSDLRARTIFEIERNYRAMQVLD
jgi:hypothetical protein